MPTRGEEEVTERERRDDTRRRHTMGTDVRGDYCHADYLYWPCPVALWIAEADRLQRELDELASREGSDG